MRTPGEDWHKRALDWQQRALKAEALVERLFNDPPAQMNTPLGLLPINSDGMRRLVDELSKWMRA